jgi:hypothetical protein
MMEAIRSPKLRFYESHKLVTSRKMASFIVTAVKTSNLTFIFFIGEFSVLLASVNVRNGDRAVRWTLGSWGFHTQQELEILLYFTASKTSLRLLETPIQKAPKDACNRSFLQLVPA